MCIRSDLLIFISLGQSQSNYFEISKDIEILHPKPGSYKVLRLDLHQF